MAIVSGLFSAFFSLGFHHGGHLGVFCFALLNGEDSLCHLILSIHVRLTLFDSGLCVSPEELTMVWSKLVFFWNSIFEALLSNSYRLIVFSRWRLLTIQDFRNWFLCSISEAPDLMLSQDCLKSHDKNLLIAWLRDLLNRKLWSSLNLCSPTHDSDSRGRRSLSFFWSLKREEEMILTSLSLFRPRRSSFMLSFYIGSKTPKPLRIESYIRLHTKQSKFTMIEFCCIAENSMIHETIC